jgi:hypothetical protein
MSSTLGQVGPELTETERELIKMLRDEAKHVKDCFTQYSFQALALAAVALSFVARYQPEHPFVAFMSVPIIVILLTVARIGTHKYATANRNYGYQLHLERIARLSAKNPIGRETIIRSMGWEEAMRAWRVVQATMFETIYSFNRFGLHFRRQNANCLNYKWFMPNTLLAPGSKWHPGSYLGNMTSVLYILAGISIIPLCVMSYQVYESARVTIAATLTLAIILCVLVKILNTQRIIREDEFLSIHSCAITWHAVAVAHYRALLALGGDDKGYVGEFKKYTWYLSLLAVDASKNLADIHEWISAADDEILRKLDKDQKPAPEATRPQTPDGAS